MDEEIARQLTIRDNMRKKLAASGRPRDLLDLENLPE